MKNTMVNKNENTSKEVLLNKNNPYTFKDSCLMFILALFLPHIIYFVFIMLVKICFNGTAFENEVLNGVTSNYISAFVCQISLIGAVLVLAKHKKVNFFKANNVCFKLDYVKVLLVIVIGLVALFGFNWLSNLISYGLSLGGYQVSNSSLTSFGVNNFGMLLLIILFLAVLPAICEEFSMRGVILSGFAKKGKNFAIFISALMFMIIHLSLEQFIYQFVLGVILATIVYHSGNILYSIILHFVNNALVLVLNYTTPHSITPEYFFSFGDYFLPVLTAAITCVIIFFLIKVFKLRCKKTNCLNLDDKLEQEKENNNTEIATKNLEAEKTKQNSLTENSQENKLRDLPNPKLEILSNKTALILSLSIGILTWILSVLSGFII